jgi:dihydroneopterin triphosphate diphosphatase
MQSSKLEGGDGLRRAVQACGAPNPFKIPRSVLVVIHTPDGQVLLIERADSQGAATGVWQSVTGSLDVEDESWIDCAAREVREETALDVHAPGHVLTDWKLENTYDIWPHYLHRYAPGITRNTERVLGLCIPQPVRVQLAPREHVNQVWLPWEQAALKVRSASNEAAIRRLQAVLAVFVS